MSDFLLDIRSSLWYTVVMAMTGDIYEGIFDHDPCSECLSQDCKCGTEIDMDKVQQQEIVLRLEKAKNSETLDTQLCNDALKLIEYLGRERIVRGSIQSGLLELEEIPEDVTVDIRDYDTECCEEDDLEEDENGKSYFNAG